MGNGQHRDDDQGEARALRERLGSGMSLDGAGVPDRDALLADLQRAFAEERGPSAWLRSRPTSVRVALAGGASVVTALVIAAVWLRQDLGGSALAPLVVTGVYLAMGTAVLLWLALRPLQRAPLPFEAATWAVTVGLLALGALYALPSLAGGLVDAHAHAHTSAADLVAAAAPCLAIGVAIALAQLVLLRALDRGGADRALLAATYAGFTANFMLQLHCPNSDPAHLLSAHLGVAALLLAGTALWSRTAQSRGPRAHRS